MPNGSQFDMTERIEDQIERLAWHLALAPASSRSTRTATELASYNPDLRRGDILGGRNDLWQLTARAALRRVLYVAHGPIHARMGQFTREPFGVVDLETMAGRTTAYTGTW